MTVSLPVNKWPRSVLISHLLRPIRGFFRSAFAVFVYYYWIILSLDVISWLSLLVFFQLNNAVHSMANLLINWLEVKVKVNLPDFLINLFLHRVKLIIRTEIEWFWFWREKFYAIFENELDLGTALSDLYNLYEVDCLLNMIFNEWFLVTNIVYKFQL